MCGIFGIVSKNGLIDSNLITKSLATIEHRGPDGSGIHVSSNVGLGHRRLSIIDLSNAALQPMKHQSLPIWIVFNGEIYNYIELRSKLIALGHTFYTDSEEDKKNKADLLTQYKFMDLKLSAIFVVTKWLWMRFA